MAIQVLEAEELHMIKKNILLYLIFFLLPYKCKRVYLLKIHTYITIHDPKKIAIYCYPKYSREKKNLNSFKYFHMGKKLK